MKRIILCAAVLAIGACTSADSAFTGSPHGISGQINSVWVDMDVVPTILQDGEAALQSDYGSGGVMRDMPSTFEADAAGNIRATGVAAYWLARAAYCRAGGDCGGANNGD